MSFDDEFTMVRCSKTQQALPVAFPWLYCPMLNAALDRLRELHPSVRPPDELLLVTKP